MGATELKNRILKLINTDNLDYLQEIVDFAEKKKEENAVNLDVFTIDGDKLRKEQYIKKVKNADDSISSGNFTTVKDLENEIKHWEYGSRPNSCYLVE